MVLIKIAYRIFSYSTCLEEKQLPWDSLRAGCRRKPEKDPADAKVCGASAFSDTHRAAFPPGCRTCDLHPPSVASTTNAMLALSLDHSAKAPQNPMNISCTKNVAYRPARRRGEKTK